MKLSPIIYVLDEHLLEPDVYLYGKLHIEIDPVDGNPYIDSFRLTRVEGNDENDEDYEQTITYENGKDATAAAIAIRNGLHLNKALMDDIFDDCAREGMWDE